MKYTAAAIVAAASGALAADSAFKLAVDSKGSEVNNLFINASQGNLFIGLPSQGATCDGAEPQEATFSLVDGKLYLYTTGTEKQQFYVDRSGMGQGKLGYITEGNGAPRNSEFDKWAVDENYNLLFDGADFIGCPNSIDGAWSVWVRAGVTNPGGNSDCINLTGKSVSQEAPVSCVYS